jgi:hypothetical protein
MWRGDLRARSSAWSRPGREFMPFKDAVMGQYYPFNIVEEIRLGEGTKVKAVVAEWYYSQSDLLICQIQC